MHTVVLYVHGLWMTGVEGALLRRRLARLLNAETPVFGYPSVRLGIADNAARLVTCLEAIRADALHLVGHSLGGLVIHEALGQIDESSLPPGRVVLLGSPIAGSRAAAAFSRWHIGKTLLGRTVNESLIHAATRCWRYPRRELGIIAGTRNMGLGRLVSRHIAPSDGTVYVDETRLEGAREARTVPVSHIGLPFSADVARQTAGFLRTGNFSC